LTTPGGPENELVPPSLEILAEPAPTFPRPLGARRAIFILAMYLLAQVAAVLLVVIILEFTKAPGEGGRFDTILEGEGIIPGAIAALILGGVVVWQLARRSFPADRGDGWLQAIGWIPSPPRDLAAGAGLGVVVAIIYLFVIGSLIPPPEDLEPGPLVNAAMTSGWARMGWALAALFLAPPVEEFLFRGVLLEGFSRSWGTLVAAVLTITIFTALHYNETSNYLPGLAAIGLLAIVTTFARITTGSLKPAIAIHAGYNLAMVGLLYLAET
jgi:membrane protease YdiL (CAAX protease family)